MALKNREKLANPLAEWIDSRLPIFTIMQKEYGSFPTPRNFNYFWSFGGMAMLVLGIMIISGVFLAMNYAANADLAFNSIERLTRDVNYGWLLRSLHMNGASMFFIVVYIHIFRGLYYGSYKQPRELLWILGVTILLLMMATAFMGYVLPWSQMSGWGATVITNLFSAFPLVGDGIVTWLWGGFSVDNPTLNRFFALHFLLPFMIVGVVLLHVWALHITGSNNPLGIDVKGKQDTIPFHPYYTVKDSVGIVVFLIFYAYIVFYAPDAFVHADHYKPFDPLVTPPQIVPEWYFLPFYAILRAFTYDISFFGTVILPAKLQGVLAMLGSIIILYFLPWIDRSPIRSARFRPMYKLFLLLLVASLVVLTYVGAQHAEEPYVTIGQLATAYYFAFFLIILPLLNRYEKPLTPPSSISQSVLDEKKKKNLSTSKKSLLFILGLGFFMSFSSIAHAASEAKHPPHQDWPQDGLTGTYDTASLQRGFQVYKQVCASCHSMKLLSYRNLTALGYSDAEIRAIAAEYTVTDGPNDEGEMFERPALPSDRFVSPYPNDNAARYANNGALPPDMSLIIKARHYGADYIYALLNGYKEPPKDVTLANGMYYNEYFPGNSLAMAPPLSQDMVTYDDGTSATVSQMAKDVTHFLSWASDPHLEERKKTGLKVLIFLIVFAGIMIAVKKKVWKDLK